MNAIKILSDLIAIDTSNPPGNELVACKYLEELFEAHNIHCEVQNLGDNRGNVIATLGTADGKELLFNGHLDVVPAQKEMWSVNPFQATEKDGKIFGRGTSDMKSGIAAMTAAAIELAEENYPLAGKLKLVFVADEECSNLGTHAYLEKYTETADYCIISEPTNMEIYTSHKGVGRYYIDFIGKPHHSSIISDELSSIQQAARGILAIEELNNELQTEISRDMTPPSVQVTMMDAYEKDNIVPAKARLLVDYRITPGRTEAEITSRISKVLIKHDLSFEIVPHFFLNAGWIDPNDEFVELCTDVLKKCTGVSPQVTSMQGSSEQVLFIERGIKTILLGPGIFEQCHCVDENLETKQLQESVVVYKELIKTLLS